jgi:hypothetical protein
MCLLLNPEETCDILKLKSRAITLALFLKRFNHQARRTPFSSEKRLVTHRFQRDGVR